MAKFGDGLYRKSIQLISSKRFFYGVLVIAALQALWYIFSFHPWINDEGKHLAKTVIYSHHLTPFLGAQNPAWDYLGAVARDDSFLFYYIMSLPLRVIGIFTDSFTVQTIILRIICLSFVIGGLIFYRRALVALNLLPKSIVNLLLLFFVITPTFALLAGAVNYDNLVFLVFGCIFWLAIRVIKSKTLRTADILAIVILSLFISLIKWASVALVVPVIIFLIVDLYKKYGPSVLPRLFDSYKKLTRYKRIIIISALIIGGGLFIEHPVVNTLRYGKPDATCAQVLGSERCRAYPEYVIYANLKENRSSAFKAVDPLEYTIIYWTPAMIGTLSNQLERGASTQLPGIAKLYKFLVVMGVLVILVCLRELLKKKENVFLLLVIVVLTLALIYVEYSAYVSVGGPVAIRARYLIPVMPLFLYLMAQSLVILFGKYRKALLCSTVAILVLMTQGASIVTYSLTAQTTLYWPNTVNKSVNENLRAFLSVVVKGEPNRSP